MWSKPLKLLASVCTIHAFHKCLITTWVNYKVNFILKISEVLSQISCAITFLCMVNKIAWWCRFVVIIVLLCCKQHEAYIGVYIMELASDLQYFCASCSLLWLPSMLPTYISTLSLLLVMVQIWYILVVRVDVSDGHFSFHHRLPIIRLFVCLYALVTTLQICTVLEWYYVV